MANGELVRLQPATLDRLGRVRLSMVRAYDAGHVYAQPMHDRHGYTVDAIVQRLLDHYEGHARRRRH